MPKQFAKPFLLILLLLVFIACYFIFRPFLIEIFVAAVLSSIFYTPYQRLSKFLQDRNKLAAFLMCLLLIIIVILPAFKLMAYTGGKSIAAYNTTVKFFSHHSVNDFFQNEFFQRGVLRYLHLESYNFNNDGFQNALLEILKQSSNWLVSGASFALVQTTNFILSLILIIITMFFFFVDGEKMLKYLMYLSPLPDKYDLELFHKFRRVSYTTFVSTFVAAIAQGVMGAIGFAIIGFPAFLAGVLVGFLSLLPYLGSSIFFVPAGLYYLLVGDIWQGVFILLWGTLVIGVIDNVIRTYMVKGEAEINPIFVLFSILGGIMLFGFWGVIIGPLVIALAVTILHIYELEFCSEGVVKHSLK